MGRGKRSGITTQPDAHTLISAHKSTNNHATIQAIVGFVWTTVLVRDKPHRSLEWTYPEKDNSREDRATPAVSAVA